MKRSIYNDLKKWKDDTSKRPLIIKGARQIGKTYIVNYLGKNDFLEFISLNFERNPEYKEIFNTYNPLDIIEKITLYTGKKITLGKTLLFLDEIQDCPKAIMSLRYFYEEMPELHIIGAGSLLEFSLNSEDYRVPVGRVQYLFMKPMSFIEFLMAKGETQLVSFIKDINNLLSIPDAIHKKLNTLVRKYFIIGGMPAVVSEYIKTQDIIKCQRIQQSIITTYIDDFSKYSKTTKHNYLKKIFNSIPTTIGNKFMYSKVDNTIKSRELKNAEELLEQAGIIYKIKRTSGAGLSLEAGIKDNFFKLIFLDVGLLHAVSGIYSETIKEKDLTSIFKGAVAEQFVGQEIIAYQSPYIKPKLFYWAREARNSNAEIDYLFSKNEKIIPAEIKSGEKGTLKSLLMFISKFETQEALKISQVKYKIDKPITNLPFYAIKTFITHN